VIHASKWGWKRLAAKLLLIPLFGGSVGVAHAQTGSGSMPGFAQPAMPGPRGGDAASSQGGDFKAMLKEGRKALAAGQFDRAQDLARAADANNKTGKWGLFDDTPNSLIKDVQAAVVKTQKSQAEQMMKDAKVLAAQPATSEQERAGNLDRAFQLAQRADQLHGPYSAWEFGERPDKLMKEIKATRDRVRVSTAAMPAAPAPGGGQNTSVFQPTSGSPANPGSMATRPTTPMPLMPVTPANDPRKIVAAQLMGDARKLADQGQFGPARVKLGEAEKAGAVFGPTEANPGFAIQELNTRGAGASERLVAEAKNFIAKKDFGRADAALNGAAEINAGLGLFPGPVKDARAQLSAASGGKFGAASTVGLVATGGPEFIVPSGPVSPLGPLSPVMNPVNPVAPVNPMNPAGVASVGGVKPAVPSGTLTGQALLTQAAYEFERGEFEMATRLATQAHNLGGVNEEANSLLRSVDAKRLDLKKAVALKSFDAAQAAVQNKDYNKALGIFVLLDTKLLPEAMQDQHTRLTIECRTQLDKVSTGVATTGGTQGSPALPSDPPLSALPGVSPGLSSGGPPGMARIGDAGTGADNLAAQQNALKQAQFQKLRADGFKVQSDAQAAFGRGETDLAMQMLLDYANRVRTSGLEPSGIAMLARPIESRLEMFRVMKGQTDSVAQQNKENRDAKERIGGRGLAEEQRKAEVVAMVRQFHELVKASKFAEAEKVALVAKQLDPDDPALGALAHMAKIQKRVREAEKLKSDREDLVLRGLNAADKEGPFVDVDDPIAFNLERSRNARKRGSLNDVHVKTRSQAEYEIEVKLDKQIPVDISQVPLELAIDNLRTLTGLPISIDTASIEAEGISLQKPISEKLTPVATRHILTIILEKAGLSYVVENDVVKVTTTKKAKGRLFTKVFSVADLVTPIPNFALPDYANMEKMIGANGINTGRLQLQGNGNTPQMSNQSLGGGTYPGATATTPGISGNMPFGPGGRLETNPLGASASLAGERNTKEAQLIKLITNMVRPYSWDGMGGAGRVEYFDIGSALVVNQVADVIQEVADLLEALRRLQDLAIAVEIRIVSLSEAWYERLGVDFAMNIKTHNASFEPSLTQIDPATGASGVFRPLPFINSNNQRGSTIGITSAGTPTGDLGVPIRPNNFNRAIPPFGGYPNTPGDNGGIAFGLAFLNDIQVSLFMEAAQGDRRVNVMQAPKLTLFNGQTANLSVNDVNFFVTNVQIVSVNGQLVYVPQNSPLPIGVQISVQAVVSADRRFVRLNLPVNLTTNFSANVPLFPITSFVVPVFEGGSQGQPIPFTQFLQQPGFTNVNIQTTVVCPDGGTVLLGGLKTLSEGRNEFGPPGLSKIPYLNRLFKNVGIGRETSHVMIMVTPRIIINSEEEINQTEGGRAPGN